jgi:hypothetical protein
VNGYGATTHSHWMSCLATNPEQWSQLSLDWNL